MGSSVYSATFLASLLAFHEEPNSLSGMTKFQKI